MVFISPNSELVVGGAVEILHVHRTSIVHCPMLVLFIVRCTEQVLFTVRCPPPNGYMFKLVFTLFTV